MLRASNCVLNEEGLPAVGFLEIDGRYPALLIQIDDPNHLISVQLRSRNPLHSECHRSNGHKHHRRFTPIHLRTARTFKVSVKYYVRVKCDPAPSLRGAKPTRVWCTDLVLLVR